MTSYGPDLPGSTSLGLLVQQVLKHVPELQRLRLSSIDQIEADAALLKVLADEPRLMPHLHLSLQAGDDMILKRMKRRHLSADAVRFCQEARRLRPDIVFGADLIAGFPTETDEMFANSLAHVDDCGLTYLHVFPFSPRKGTPAARMPQVAKPAVKARAAQLRARGDAALTAYLDQQIGRETDILLERATMGRTPQFAEVELTANAAAIDTPSSTIGTFKRVRIIGRADHRLLGATIS
jgi:threonylcarbamoyladenosine tRNA methylthiotransferase MtaB